jgi:RimJ/RimL family protein N-acetyltransferase
MSTDRSAIAIAAMDPLNLGPFHAHFRRHRAESGRGDAHFMPFAPDDEDGPKGLAVEGLARSLRELRWQRWFLATTDQGDVVGHVNLKSDGVRVGLHRCELGIGIERAYRRQGLGRRLMQTAIEFARDAETLSWVDLRVFAHNAAGRALYRSLGFVEIGTLVDRFRIEGQRIDDVLMTLRL